VKVIIAASALFLATFIVVSAASSVQVTRVNVQTQKGLLTYVYFETISGPGSTTPSTNTAQTPPGSSGSYRVSRGSSGYLWSPQFASATQISSGTWVLDLWAEGRTSGSMYVSIYVTNSAGTVQSTIVSNAVTPVIGTSITQVAMRFSGSSVTVPAGGYINVVLYAPTGSGNPTYYNIYWGTGQLTNFQVPYRVLS
jgi:hypothetical protein